MKKKEMISEIKNIEVKGPFQGIKKMKKRKEKSGRLGQIYL